MILAQLEFFIFLTALIALLYILKGNNIKKCILLSFSVYFYMLIDCSFLLLMLFSTLFTYIVGQKINDDEREAYRKRYMLFGIFVNISILFAFKYYDFFIHNISALFPITSKHVTSLNLLLPVGISFYTFRYISYLVDVWQNKVKSTPIIDFLIYGTFFPIILSGPISRASSFLPQLNKIEISTNNLYQGYRLFVIGLFLKIFVANKIAYFNNYYFDNYQLFDTLTSWIAVLSYTVEIYTDFAGYSSMAIGVSMMLGIHIEKNFNFPYLAENIIDFWKRWHITLSTWIKDYLYIPLGGGRRGQGRKYINILIAMVLCGLWHGAAWTFIVWGLLHGLLLVLNHMWKGIQFQSYNLDDSKIYSFLSCCLTFISVSICWIFFRSDTIWIAFEILKKLFLFNGIHEVQWIHPFVIFIVAATFIVHLFKVFQFDLITIPAESKITPAVLFCMIWLIIVFFLADFHPFIYEQF